MTRNGIAYQRQPLAPLLGGIAYGSFPSPMASMAKNGWPFSIGTKGRFSKRVMMRTALEYGRRPPAHLLEWLMGFPIGWTELEPSEMPSSRKSLKSSDER